MSAGLSSKVIILVLFFLVAKASAASTMSTHQASQSWNFRVFLDDTPIGYHKVNILNQEDKKVIHTTANFDVTFFFIPFYTYTHETRETWEDDCLVSISSKTDDNGDDYFIKSEQVNNEMSLDTQDGSKTIDGCVRTFAYWDVDLLKANRLLNTQTGEYQAVSITNMGVTNLSIDGEQVEAYQYRLICEDMTINLWYTPEMRWLALESTTESGAVIRYLPESLIDSKQKVNS